MISYQFNGFSEPDGASEQFISERGEPQDRDSKSQGV